MHEDELALLRQLREVVGRLADDLDRAIEQRENRVTEARAEERRRHFKLVAIPLGIGVAAAATRAWIGRNAQTIAVAGSAAAITATGTLAVARGGDDPVPEAAPAVTAPAPTRPDKSPTPAKSRRPTKPGPAPTAPPILPPPSPPTSPTPTPSTGIPLVGTIPPVQVKPPKVHPLYPAHPLHPTTGGPRSEGGAGEDAADSTQQCRVNLLGVNLLCGRLAR